VESSSSSVAEPSRVDEHAARQAPRRERETQARQAAVRFVEQHVPSCRQASRCLQLSPRTLASWRRRQACDELIARPRGRAVREASREERAVVAAILEETGPRLGVPALQTCCPETPRCVLQHLVRDRRRQFQAEHRLVVETLHWKRPGSVWAIDHSQPPRPIEGRYEQILAVRDLASGMQLAWSPVEGATAEEALPVLQSLAMNHGPPLLLKSDNGSAFKSGAFAAWLEEWRIVPLFSPVRMPRFNGSCEAGIGGAKRRTEQLAARRGEYLDWSANDLFAAQEWANHDHYPSGLAAGTPAERFAARRPFDPNERDAFRQAVVQFERQFNHDVCIAGDAMTDALRAAHHRRAVRRALVEFGYLDITRRSIPQPIQTAKCARIT
jgi:transposase InsO family protein